MIAGLNTDIVTVLFIVVGLGCGVVASIHAGLITFITEDTVYLFVIDGAASRIFLLIWVNLLST